jgi:hypothetical protein
VVVALAVELGRVVVLPERLEQDVDVDDRGVVDDLDGLGVARCGRCRSARTTGSGVKPPV